MNKNQKLTLTIVPFIALLLWLMMPKTTPWWEKLLALSINFGIGIIFLFHFLSETKKEKVEKYFGLTEKLYTCTLLAAMGVYTKGIWAITPDTHPVWLKHLFLGAGLLILVGFFLYFAFKKVDEKADDRFYMNLAKAASLTLILVLLSLIILSIITFFMPFTLNAGMVLIYGAAMILIFDISFWVFEKRGE